MFTLLMMSLKLVNAAISSSMVNSIINKCFLLIIIIVYNEHSHSHFVLLMNTEGSFRLNKIGKWSEISEISMPETKLLGSVVNKLSIGVAQLLVIRVGNS